MKYIATQTKFIIMKLVILLYLVILTVNVQAFYEIDGMDLEAVVANRGHLYDYYTCFVDRGPCSDAGKIIKRVLPTIFETACEHCTDSHKHILRRFLEELKRKMPKQYKEFRKKYDPNNKYFKTLAWAIAKF